MKTLCVIGARGGSKGLPGKNIKMLLGKPLIAWTIEEALKTSEIDKVVVSTDSNEIAEVAMKYGAEVPFIRPEDISGSKVGKFDVWKHALDKCEGYYKEKYDIEAGIEYLIEEKMFSTDNIVGYGVSFGGASLIHAVADGAKFERIITDSSFASINTMAKKVVEIFTDVK